ncbi:hypothetical protein L6R52_11540 [Myxococcota bacterium]|nr:hypothetical protein [Myxococcota bacterium]
MAPPASTRPADEVISPVSVVSPSASAESLWVFRATFWILFAAFTFVSLRPDGRRGTEAATATFEHQVRFGDLAPEEQRVVRELGEALAEAEQLRSAEGRWPDDARLAELGVPPFAADPTRTTSRTWRFATDGRFASWIGAPADGAAIRWALLFVEEAGERRAVTATGQKAPLEAGHRELDDGALVHVSIWLRDGAPSAGAEPVRQPIQEGWREVVLDRTAGGSR